MLRNRYRLLFLVILLILSGDILYSQNVQNNKTKNITFESLYFDERHEILVPWEGFSIKSRLVSKIDPSKLKDSDIRIDHPENYTLFINDKLYYQNENSGKLIITRLNLDSIIDDDEIVLTHISKLINQNNFSIYITAPKSFLDFEVAPIYERSASHNSLELSIYLLIFFLISVSKFRFSREFDFYYAGKFLQSPKLNLEKFLGDSINPLFILFSCILLSLVIYPYSEIIFNIKNGPKNALIEFAGFNLGSFIIVLGACVIYLIFKRISYWFFLWMKKDLKNLSGIWRNYLLTFTNLSFWTFLVFSGIKIINWNLDFGKLFQILFFIFAALNAAGGIMAYSNLKIRMDILTLCSILAIDIFPIILLIQFLTF